MSDMVPNLRIICMLHSKLSSFIYLFKYVICLLLMAVVHVYGWGDYLCRKLNMF